VLYGDDVFRLGGPGQNERYRSQFPWRRALQVVSSPVSVTSQFEPGALS